MTQGQILRFAQDDRWGAQDDRWGAQEDNGVRCVVDVLHIGHDDLDGVAAGPAPARDLKITAWGIFGSQ